MATLAIVTLSACSFDGTEPGTTGLCATSVGQPLCEQPPIERSQEACAKLVDCGSIPVAPPDDVDNPGSYFTYSTCVDRLDALDSHRQSIAFHCIATSTCDELRFRGGPEEPRNNPSNMPPCLEYGDQ